MPPAGGLRLRRPSDSWLAGKLPVDVWLQPHPLRSGSSGLRSTEGSRRGHFHQTAGSRLSTAVPDVESRPPDSIAPAQPECERRRGAFIDAGLQLSADPPASARHTRLPDRLRGQSTRPPQSKPLQALTAGQRSSSSRPALTWSAPVQDGVINASLAGLSLPVRTRNEAPSYRPRPALLLPLAQANRTPALAGFCSGFCWR